MSNNSLSELPSLQRSGIRRYATLPFPSYRYVPGLHPHPRRDPAGHSYDPRPIPSRHPEWRPQDWRRLEPWLFGIDLFNQLYLWEAHEAWESLWASTPRGEPPSLLLQGLIQIAAALLKAHMGVLSGARMLSREGLDKLHRAADQHRILLGLEIPPTIAAFSTFFQPLAGDELPRVDATVPVLRLIGEDE
jgi:hypothetical protein